MVRCNSGQKCQYSWSSMRTTQEEKVRFCPQCQQTVHWVNNFAELKDSAHKSQCIAFEPANVLQSAELAEEVKQVKQFFVLPAQKLSLKQLNHIKKYIHPEWSLRQLRDSYHNKASIIKFDGNKAETDQLVAILRRLGIKLDVKREEIV